MVVSLDLRNAYTSYMSTRGATVHAERRGFDAPPVPPPRCGCRVEELLDVRNAPDCAGGDPEVGSHGTWLHRSEKATMFSVLLESRGGLF